VLNEMTLTPNSRKRAARVSSAPAKRRLAWPEVLRVIQGDWARSFVLARFREAGFSGDSWADRKSREFMAGLLSAAEDTLELRAQGHVIAAERAAIRALRRRLELELWS
jgi:hypothetical protein